jgi:hypothetical protein
MYHTCLLQYISLLPMLQIPQQELIPIRRWGLLVYDAGTHVD